MHRWGAGALLYLGSITNSSQMVKQFIGTSRYNRASERMKRFWSRQDLPVGAGVVGKADPGFVRRIVAGW
jgi:hypothetical protein